MILLMPCELQLKHRGKLWGIIRAEVSADGEVFDVDIKPSGATAWSPFCKATVVEGRLAFRMFGQMAQQGEVTDDGVVHRRPSDPAA